MSKPEYIKILKRDAKLADYRRDERMRKRFADAFRRLSTKTSAVPYYCRE